MQASSRFAEQTCQEQPRLVPQAALDMAVMGAGYMTKPHRQADAGRDLSHCATGSGAIVGR